jgi:hypothetical protein
MNSNVLSVERIESQNKQQSFPLSRYQYEKGNNGKRTREKEERESRDIIFDESLSSRRSVEILYSLSLFLSPNEVK